MVILLTFLILKLKILMKKSKKKKDRKKLFDKIPMPLTLSHVLESTLDQYNYRIVDFLHGKFKAKWFYKSKATKRRDLKKIKWKDILEHYNKQAKKHKSGE